MFFPFLNHKENRMTQSPQDNAPAPAAPAPPTDQGAPSLQDASSKKVLCGVLAIILGSLGIHKFVLGYSKAGIIMLLVSVLTLALGLRS